MPEECESKGSNRFVPHRLLQPAVAAVLACYWCVATALLPHSLAAARRVRPPSRQCNLFALFRIFCLHPLLKVGMSYAKLNLTPQTPMKMRAFMCVTVGVLLVTAAPVLAAYNAFFDNFDTGVSGSTWAAVPGNVNNQVLIGDNAHTFGGSAQSAKQVNADPAIYYMRTINGWNAGTVLSGQTIVADVKFWDDGNPYVTGTPLGGGLMLGSGSNIADFYQLLVNSGTSIGGFATDYLIRSKISGNVDSGVARSQGWHDFKIEVLPYTGANDVRLHRREPRRDPQPDRRRPANGRNYAWG